MSMARRARRPQLQPKQSNPTQTRKTKASSDCLQRISGNAVKLDRTQVHGYSQSRSGTTSPSMESGFAAFHTDFSESNPPRKPSQTQQPRQRRRQSSTTDGPKHRRTRSGCYTCRQRRVKCDETHPICDRCRKGKRECTYPSNASATFGSSSKVASHRAHEDTMSKGTSSDGHSSPSIDNDDAEEAKYEPLLIIPDDNEGEARDSLATPQQSPTVALPQLGFAAKRESETTTRKRSVRPDRLQSRRSSTARASKDHDVTRSEKWQRLPKEMDAYLRYHRAYLTYHHYAFKYDRTDFLKTTFLEIALNDDSSALLYAIVAFAAYHHAIQNARDSWQTFLAYYNKAIEALNKDLEKYKRHNTATLLTILQLATIEEFLGDWVNLYHHQRAAYQVLTELYRVDTIMQDETRRKITMWYFRFDIFASLLSGNRPCLGREWYAACAKFYRAQASQQPGDVAMVVEDCFATSRLLAIDISLLFAAKRKGTISESQFASDVETLLQDLDAFGRRLGNTFTDDSCFADVDTISPLAPGDPELVDFREPRVLYSGDYFSMNFVLLDYWALHLVFDYQLCMLQGRYISPKLGEIALQKCKIIEAIYHSKERPNGSMLGCQASLAAASLFLGTTPERIEWCRRRYAMIESEGYIYPAKIREQMSRIWGEDVLYWWLPNRARLSPTIQMIKDFVEFRKTVPQDLTIANLCDMSGMFQSLDEIDNSLSPVDARLPRVDSGYSYHSQPTAWSFRHEPATTST